MELVERNAHNAWTHSLDFQRPVVARVTAAEMGVEVVFVINRLANAPARYDIVSFHFP